MKSGRSGKLLVAHPNLKDSIFKKSVVYICCDNQHEGTIGLILNRQTDSDIRLFFESMRLNYYGSDYFYNGGPINIESLILLHSDDWSSESSMPVKNNLSMSSDLLMLEKFDLGDVPDNWKMFRGISYWHPGQLESEINSATGWQVLDVDDEVQSLMFDYTNTAMWHEALMHCSRNFMDQFA